MNDQIKEIALQAGMQKTSLHYGRRDPYVLWEDDIEKFARLLLADYATKLVEANMRSPEYEAAMDAYYENKWGHRFD